MCGSDPAAACLLCVCAHSDEKHLLRLRALVARVQGAVASVRSRLPPLHATLTSVFVASLQGYSSLVSAFAAFDKNGDGFVSQAEVRRGSAALCLMLDR